VQPQKRIVITGIGLTSPIGNNLKEFRENLIKGISGIREIEIRYMGKVLAGVCEFDVCKYQKRKEVRRGTRAGSIAVYCANEAFIDASLDKENIDRSNIGIFLGITEHGNVETENEIYNISKYDYNVAYWSHHHNPRTVANNPAGEVTLNMKITGPHYCLGAACAAGNVGLIQGYQMLQLEEVEYALCGGVSESIHTFGIFASFKSQVALATHEKPEKASRPLDKDRNGIVVSEGGCIFLLESLESAISRGAKIYAEVVGYAQNSDAMDFVLPNYKQQVACMKKALKRVELQPEQIDLVNLHATSTPMGDVEEAKAVREVFGSSDFTYINGTKGHIGHAMGAAGALELAGNIPAFEDGIIHPAINIENLDPACEMKNLIMNEPYEHGKINYILNNSFGMLGINSVVIVKKFQN